MSQPSSTEFALALELPEDPAQAEASRAKAATAVEDFVAGEALGALDTLLAAADNGARVTPDLPRRVSATSALVDAEVARFRSLDRRGS